ncbi:MAG: iron complex outerrane recepter protein [Gammaproteobacteria bacterium]|jgi:iron complex outermembrane receptor protein|nr:iron complex outerrane recepter protein [Gammaproteobacteria bacterium]
MENSQNERPFFNEAPPRNTFARFNNQRTLVAKAIAANLASLNCRVVNGIAAGLAASVISLTATGQEAPLSANAATPEMQEVVITGTMIKRVDAETAEAVTILKADALKDQGITNVEQVLNTLTSANPSVNMATAVGTFSGGGTYADLRGLGRSRTLILLDGQRVAVNAFDGQGVDLSGVPFSAIDSVEVLREGASALYGSDAIAGVINFKTKKNYQGAEFQINFDHPQKAGGGSGQADFTFGHGDLVNDGYNFMVTASYAKQQELQATQRGFSAQGFDPARGVTATNFPGSWPGIVQDSDSNLYQSGYPACAGNSQLTTYYGDCSYRYSAATDLIPQTRTISGMAAFTKTLPANNQVQVQYFWSQSKLTGYSGPMFYDFAMDPTSPYFPSASQLICDRGPENCATPLNLSGVNSTTGEPQAVNAIWTDPNNYRYNGYLNVEQRVLLTFSGSNAGWDYSAAFNYSKNHNDGRNVGGYPNEDVLAPGGVLSPLINPFGPQSAAGQSLINSSYINGVYQLGQDTRWSVDLTASHSLGDAFDAGTPATVAFGANASGESFTNYTTPYNDLTSAATGLGDSSVAGNRKIQAAFIELDVPITKALDFDVSDRQDRYSDFGTTNNAKVKVRWQPLDMLTFRGSASTGFRAPTLFNLYAPPFLTAASGGTMGDGNPFCQPGSYNAEWTPQTCAAQGIGLNGGNTKLTPETSQNFDLGVVLQPIQDLGITLDYYRILLKNTIGRVPASAIYGDPDTFASYITTATSGQYAGSLPPTIAQAANCTPYTAPTCGYINRAFANTGRITTDGFDLSVQYVQHTPIGTFREDLEGTAVTQFLEQQYTGGPTLNLVGNLQIQTINPAFRWQHNVRVDWTSPQKMYGAGLSDRFYSGYIDEFPDANGNQLHVGSYSLVDGYVSVKPIENLSVLFGIKNLFNTSPPFTNASQNNFASGYNALVADPLLRNFYINLKYTL